MPSQVTERIALLFDPRSDLDWLLAPWDSNLDLHGRCRRFFLRRRRTCLRCCLLGR